MCSKIRNSASEGSSVAVDDTQAGPSALPPERGQPPAGCCAAGLLYGVAPPAAEAWIWLYPNAQLLPRPDCNG